jgi:hypothetical protein
MIVPHSRENDNSLPFFGCPSKFCALGLRLQEKARKPLAVVRDQAVLLANVVQDARKTAFGGCDSVFFSET